MYRKQDTMSQKVKVIKNPQINKNKNNPTLMGICQRITRANSKSSQWPKQKQFEGKKNPVV